MRQEDGQPGKTTDEGIKDDPAPVTGAQAQGGGHIVGAFCLSFIFKNMLRPVPRGQATVEGSWG